MIGLWCNGSTTGFGSVCPDMFDICGSHWNRKDKICLFGEIVSAPFEIKHTASDINSLVELINSVEGESRIVMEHTGRYYEVLAHQLSEANLFVSAINPKLIKDFDNDSLRKVKSDKADAVKIARYALDKWQNLKQYSVMDELRINLKP